MAENELQTIRNTNAVLEAVLEHRCLGVTALADTTEMPKTTVQYYVNTLTSLGWLERTDDGYVIGPQLLSIGLQERDGGGIFAAGRAQVDLLATRYDVAAALFASRNGQTLVVYRTSADGDYFGCPPCGTMAEYPATAAGRSISVYEYEGGAKPVDDVDDNIDVDSAIEEGYVWIEDSPGIDSIGAPIITERDGVIGAVAVYLPGVRLDESDFRRELCHSVREASNEIQILYDEG
jgi:DNA-binding IclR family transcriptional regulator